jgi:hypothetical protein
LAGFAVLAGLSACGSRPHSVTVHTLETAAAVEPRATQRAIVSTLPAGGGAGYALGQRLSLFEVRTPGQWQSLRRHAPELGPCPDLSRGIIVGLASHAGMPLDGQWPIRLDTVRVYKGAGFVIASFAGGSYLPDGTTYLETAQFEGLRSVLMVEVNGVRFYPQ